MSEMQIIQCSYKKHAAPILDIINEAILHSTAIYDYEPRTLASMRGWFETKERNRFPVIGVEDEAGNLMGYASYGIFRAWPAYKYTVEHSVYIHKNHRRKGLACLLMQELIELAKSQDVHVMMACIDMKNAASIALHEKLGFRQSGILRQAGFKFGAWLDVGMYQLTLDTPLHPVDG